MPALEDWREGDFLEPVTVKLKWKEPGLVGEEGRHFSVPGQCKGREVGTALRLSGRTRETVWLKESD